MLFQGSFYRQVAKVGKRDSKALLPQRRRGLRVKREKLGVVKVPCVLKQFIQVLLCTFLCVVLVCIGCQSENSNPFEYMDDKASSTNLSKDLKMMWKTEIPKRLILEDGEHVSTEPAILAASKVFNTVKLEGKTKLEDLDIQGTKVTDLSPLKDCKNLNNLNIKDTKEKIIPKHHCVQLMKIKEEAQIHGEQLEDIK